MVLKLEVEKIEKGKQNNNIIFLVEFNILKWI